MRLCKLTDLPESSLAIFEISRQSAWIVVALYKFSGFGCNILRVTGRNFLCNCSD